MHQSISRNRVPVTSSLEDDIDKLFNHLDQLEPPDELVARILTRIRHLPESSAFPPPFLGEEHEKLLVRNEWRDPS
ncbi:MAG: hypothetical protein ACRDHZ_03590 [Ktedonobacteraceae bacterium]